MTVRKQLRGRWWQPWLARVPRHSWKHQLQARLARNAGPDLWIIIFNLPSPNGEIQISQNCPCKPCLPLSVFVISNPGSSCTVGAPGDNPVGPQCADVCARAVDMQFVECSTPRHILGPRSSLLGPASQRPWDWRTIDIYPDQVTMWAQLEADADASAATRTRLWIWT